MSVKIVSETAHLKFITFSACFSKIILCPGIVSKPTKVLRLTVLLKFLEGPLVWGSGSSSFF